MKVVHELEIHRIGLDGHAPHPECDFDAEDLAFITRALRRERERCEPWERHALNRMIDLLESRDEQPAP